jgi:hypothetical protein
VNGTEIALIFGITQPSCGLDFGEPHETRRSLRGRGTNHPPSPTLGSTPERRRVASQQATVASNEHPHYTTLLQQYGTSTSFNPPPAAGELHLCLLLSQRIRDSTIDYFSVKFAQQHHCCTVARHERRQVGCPRSLQAIPSFIFAL